MQVIVLSDRVVGFNSKDRYLNLKSPDCNFLYTYVCLLSKKKCMYIMRNKNKTYVPY
jgi:hypothetical protein